MLRYTLYRVLLFAACLGLLWLLGLRGESNLFFLLMGAALLSAVLSYFGLRRYREDYSRQVSDRIEARTAAYQAGLSRDRSEPSDEDAEDAEDAGRQQA